MNIKQSILSVAVVSVCMVACGSSREVAITGEVKAASSLQGDIVLEFFDVSGDDGDRESVHTARLGELGEFSETVALDGDRVVVFALDDADDDGVCSAGEAWAEVEAEIAEDDTVSGVELVLEATPCPVTEAAAD